LPYTGTAGLKQWIPIDQIPKQVPRHDHDEMHFVEKAQRRAQEVRESGYTWRHKRSRQLLYPPVEWRFCSLDLIEESVQNGASLPTEKPDLKQTATV
jgi:hypothetical protein